MHGAIYIWNASSEIAEGRQHNMQAGVGSLRRFLLHMVGFAVGWLHVLRPGRGEVAVLICRK